MPRADVLDPAPGVAGLDAVEECPRRRIVRPVEQEIGADLASTAGLSEEAVLYIRTHHQPDGPAAELHLVDEAV